jgi:hypothetical protein
MFEADHLYLDFVGRDSFYGFLATERGNLFHDEDFGRLYCPDNGRNSVPPSLLATALLLQAHDRVSDEEAKARADFDTRWKVALGIQIDQRLFATPSRCSSGRARCSCFGRNSSCMTRCGQFFSAAWNTPRRRDTCKDGR